MKKMILATKLGMTTVFAEDGTIIPVTVLEAGPCVVVQRKTKAKDGYDAVQVGYGSVKPRRVNKPTTGHYQATLGKDATVCRVLRELKIDDIDEYPPGSTIKADVFAVGDKVDVSGISKGKGYQGAIKRHGSHRGPMTHGSKYHRGLGSMSANSDPARVFKGKKMPGHMGAVRITVQNLAVVRADGEKNLLLVKGAVPGPRGSLLMVKSTVKNN